MALISDASQLPTFEDMACEALKSAEAARDWLRSDWRDGAGPTDAQGDAKLEAQRALSKAVAALERALGYA